jgi:hypothetical protein
MSPPRDYLPNKRPLPWCAADDYDGHGVPAYESAARNLDIAAWDAEKAKRLRSMSLWQRIVYTFFYSSDTMP